MLGRSIPKPGPRRLLGSSLFLCVAFATGATLAADAAAPDKALDDANASTAKAIALMKAATSPKGQDGFEAHRKKAIDLLTRAQGEILKAKGE